jgi:hypothetical protein
VSVDENMSTLPDFQRWAMELSVCLDSGRPGFSSVSKRLGPGRPVRGRMFN